MPVAAERSDAVAVLYALVAASFTVSGAIASARRPASRIGELMTWFAIVWAVSYLTGFSTSPLIYTVGGILVNVRYAVYAAILVAFPSGRLALPLDRAIVGSILFAGLPLEIVRLLFLEPAAGPGNALLAWPSDATADAISAVQRVIFVAAVAVMLVVLVRRWLGATAAGRRTLTPAVAGTPLFVLAAIIAVGGTIPDSLLRPLLVAFMAAPVALLASMLQARLARSAVADLIVALRGDPGPAAIRDAFARSLRDPTLTVAYWLPEYGTYADADGAPVDVTPQSGRAITPVDRNDTRIAALVHDASLCDEPQLLDAVAAAAAISLENARLHVELRARLEELRGSRARIVEAVDAERRRIERDLHDGAQQRMVAVAMQLQMVRKRIRSDPEAAEQLAAEASDQLAASLKELRELARGIHPAVLQQGLGPALDALASRSPVPAAVAVEAAGRLPERVEFAAYFVASEALANVAKYSRATAVTLRVRRTGDVATIEIADNGVGGADDSRGTGLRGLADRVEALDGRLRVVSPAGEGTVVYAELPCAS
jgi:signal transduction histidine kinase